MPWADAANVVPFTIVDSSGRVVAVIDTNGIKIYDNAGNLVVRIDASGMTTFSAANANAALVAGGPNALLNMGLPISALASGALFSTNDQGGPDHVPRLVINGPSNNVTARIASFNLYGSGVTTLTSRAVITGDAIQLTTGGTDGVAVDPANHAIKAFKGGAAETWHKVTGGIGYQNGFTDRGAGYAPVQYQLTAENEVQIVGAAQTGTVAAGTVIFTVPAGYRPTAIVQCPIQGNAGDAVIELNTNGDCKLFNYAAGAIGINGRFPLDTLT